MNWSEGTMRKTNKMSVNETKLHKRKILGIRFQLTIAFFVPVICIIILGVVSYMRTSTAVREQYKKSTAQTMGKAVDYLHLLMLDVENTAYDLSVDTTLVSHYNGTAVDVDFSDVMKRMKAALGVDEYVKAGYFISVNGEHISTNGNITFGNDAYDKYLASDDYIQVSSRNKKVWISNSQFLSEYKKNDTNKNITGTLTLTRIIDNSLTGKPLGYLILEVRDEKIADVLTDLDFGQDSMVILVSQDLQEIALSKNLDDSMEKLIVDTTEFSDILQDSAAEGQTDFIYDGTKYFLCYNYIGALGNILIGLVPETTMLAQANEIKFLTIILVTIASILAIGIGGIMALGMSRNIKLIIKNVERAAKGDLTVNITTKRKDEFAELSYSINSMIQNVKYLISKVQTVSLQVESAVNTVSNTSIHVNQSAREIGVAIEQIEGGVEQQAENSESCLLGMDDLAAKITDVANNTKEIEVISNDSKEIVGSGMKAMNILRSKSGETTEITNEIINEVEKLGDQVKNIYSIIGVISEIADQTNLLSLNASIEAARAGEVGKGFAVVATEVKKLADQSMMAAKQIEDIISNVYTQTSKAVERATLAGTILESEKLALEDAVLAFSNINEHVSKLALNIKEISTGTEIIENSKVTTLDAVQGISAVAEQTAAAAVEMSASVDSQITEMNKLSQFATELNEYSTKLQEAIQIFKVE
ncbi:MAG: methyl-accepting chemotaxis sensory transducer [Anaerocolumna sp.]|nr:methyl-accepting chemotaxis sensory transducer [Anaerocolumna sp.]